MGKLNKSKTNLFRKNKKVHTVVKFDQDARKTYLNAFVGAKKRRKQFGLKRKQQTEKQKRKDEKKEVRNERKKELEKIKEELRVKKEVEREKEHEVVDYKKGGQQVSITTTFS